MGYSSPCSVHGTYEAETIIKTFVHFFAGYPTVLTTKQKSGFSGIMLKFF
jgi:hypothetical protein